jgi:hypothetical protein
MVGDGRGDGPSYVPSVVDVLVAVAAVAIVAMLGYAASRASPLRAAIVPKLHLLSQLTEQMDLHLRTITPPHTRAFLRVRVLIRPFRLHVPFVYMSVCARACACVHVLHVLHVCMCACVHVCMCACAACVVVRVLSSLPGLTRSGMHRDAS